jgi:prolipoprotein diacylglyceryl transferase
MPPATIPSPDRRVLEIGPVPIHFYGIAIALGLILAVWLLRRRWAAVGGDPDLVDRTAVWAVVAGVIGARLGFVTTNFPSFLERPQHIVAIWEGGLVFFGGLLFGAVTAVWYLRRQRVDLASFADATAPVLPLAHAIGRWGNYFNQELYGSPTDLPWGLEIEREPTPVHPTFLYESLANLVLCGVLIWLGRTRRVARGALLFCYLIGYGVIRFLLEQIRVDTDFRFLGQSRNAYAALLVIAIGIAGLLWQRRRAAATDAVGADRS